MLVLMGIGLLVTLGAAVLLYARSQRFASATRAMALAAVAALVLSLGLELTLFNVNYYASAGYHATDLAPYLQDSLSCEGTYCLGEDDSLTANGLDCAVKNVRFTFEEPADEAASTPVVKIYLTDEANERYFATPERPLYPDVKDACTVNVHTAGKSQKIAFRFSSDEGSVVLRKVEINVQRPFNFSALRVLFLTGALLLLYLFRPSSVLYKRKLSASPDLRRTLVGSFACLELAVIVLLGALNPTFMAVASKNYNRWAWDGKGINTFSLPMQNHNQYDDLARAILEDGHLYIDRDDVPQSLQDLPNPYDPAARSAAAAASGDTYRWDVAYYNGHYYVYFGLVPLVLLYLPFRAVTGTPFPSAVGVMLFAALFAFGVLSLLRLIAEKKFRSLSLGAFLLVALAAVNGCGMIFIAKRPDFYSVPIIAACAFTVWGLRLWLDGLWNGKKRLLFYAAGSLCMALAVGCRPQSVLLSAVALPLFLPQFFGKAAKGRAGKVRELAVLAAPYVAVAAVIMAYNAARFSSPFDFGSAYNLTTNDISRRGFVFARLGQGAYTYLFQPPVFTSAFPFLQSAEIATYYAGDTYSEYCFGGLIACQPLLWSLFALPRAGKSLRKAQLWGVVLTLVAVGVALVAVDAEGGGLLQRYYTDFGPAFYLAGAVTVFALLEQQKTDRERRALTGLVAFASISGIIYTILLAFSQADVTIDTENPFVYGTLAHLVQFWL